MGKKVYSKGEVLGSKLSRQKTVYHLEPTAEAAGAQTQKEEKNLVGFSLFFNDFYWPSSFDLDNKVSSQKKLEIEKISIKPNSFLSASRKKVFAMDKISWTFFRKNLFENSWKFKLDPNLSVVATIGKEADPPFSPQKNNKNKEMTRSSQHS